MWHAAIGFRHWEYYWGSAQRNPTEYLMGLKPRAGNGVAGVGARDHPGRGGVKVDLAARVVLARQLMQGFQGASTLGSATQRPVRPGPLTLGRSRISGLLISADWRRARSQNSSAPCVGPRELPVGRGFASGALGKIGDKGVDCAPHLPLRFGDQPSVAPPLCRQPCRSAHGTHGNFAEHRL